MDMENSLLTVVFDGIKIHTTRVISCSRLIFHVLTVTYSNKVVNKQSLVNQGYNLLYLLLTSKSGL